MAPMDRGVLSVHGDTEVPLVLTPEAAAKEALQRLIRIIGIIGAIVSSNNLELLDKRLRKQQSTAIYVQSYL
jgi:hypothetical protein